ncbi:MAG: leucine-rich repeat protein [Bacilli bacterium]|nr:leucine-rich repeat protein [Bacilli bacterium]
MKQRGKIIEWLILLATCILFLLFFVPNEEGFTPSFYNNSFYRFYVSIIDLHIFATIVIIVTNLTLISIKTSKKEVFIVLKILTIIQFALFIPVLFAVLEVYDFTFITIILMNLSLLQVLNLFFISPKRYKRASIVASSIVLIFLSVYSILFWTVSRFEFELNDDGQSYSIVSIESDIPTIRIPSTYQGFPVTKINSNYYIYQNIQEIIFEEDSHIEIIEQTAFRCRNLRKITLPSSLHTIGENAFSSCYNLEEVYISIGVINIQRRAFMSKNLIIYCETESRPDTWDDNWCYQAKEIIWGYGG